MDVEIRELNPQPTLVVRRRVKVTAIGPFIQEAFGAVYSLVARRGASPVGMPFTRYLAMSEDSFDLEAGTAIAATMDGEGPVVAGELPGGTCAVCWHIGPFETVGETYNALTNWLADHGQTSAGPPWECYWTSPAEEPDPSKWRTEVFQPVTAQT